MKYSDEWLSLSKELQTTIATFQDELPVKVGALASSLGLEVKVATLDVGISGMIVPAAAGDFKVVVNKHEPQHRKRFTLAHEIAHFLLHEDLIGDGITDNILYRSKLSNDVEAEANRLASDILMPPTKVDAIKASLRGMREADALNHLSRQFDVSEEAMRIRLGKRK